MPAAAVLLLLSASAWAAAALPAQACTEGTVLELVAALESGGDYDAHYHAAPEPPPRPLTSMTVGEVLAWQRSAVRAGSVSTAAGRYQIIRPTLQRLADAGAVSPSERFDAAVQDRLGLRLLRETGYRDGDASPEAANAIARVWAALPRVGGAGDGYSVYEGIAGNHALIRSDVFQGVLGCTVSVSAAAGQAAAVSAGLRFGFSWDRFLEDIAEASRAVLVTTARYGVSLLLLLFTLDLVLRGGRWAAGGGGLAQAFGALACRLAVVILCLLLLTWPGEILDALADFVRDAAGTAAPGGGFSLSDFAAGRMALVFSLFEGLGAYPAPAAAFVWAVAVAVTVAYGLQAGLVVFWSVKLLFTGAAGLLAAGFGGLTEGVPVMRSYLVSLLASAFSLLALLTALAAFGDIAWTARSETSAPAAAALLLLLETMALMLAWQLPRSAAAFARG